MIKRFSDFSNNSSLRILVIDVESTCQVEISEIIEIGISDTDNKLNDTILIKPEFSEINSFCTALTTLTDEYVQRHGKFVEEAYSMLNQIARGYSTWASYGEYDKKMFDRMSDLYDIDINLPSQHINVRGLFAQKVLGSKNPQDAPKNPKDALAQIGQKFIGVNHRGIDDAKNIALLLNLLMK